MLTRSRRRDAPRSPTTGFRDVYLPTEYARTTHRRWRGTGSVRARHAAREVPARDVKRGNLDYHFGRDA